MSGGAVVAAAGIFGVVVFGKELLEFYNSGETLSLKTRFLSDLYEVKITACSVPAICGLWFCYKKTDNLKDNINVKKSLVKRLKSFKNMEKGI